MIRQIDGSFRKFDLVQFIDKHVGARIQLRRLILGLSADELGNETGCSAVQIQRYEQGLERVRASKLFDLATVLCVPVTHFFDGLEVPPVRGCSSEDGFVFDNEATCLIASYHGVSPEEREEIFAHTVALGKPQAGKLN
ncbi:helix-turn-helix domain-containing protein [Roseovarius sp. MMSF_3305]|uniref:helix-turn-helix domain-containing protein n=1 Tax=unclassified Roseovarius TaxID=2614913 RepID=UPI00273E9B2F|nr:helix-turn-helix transcriptional regulator [Roseovarius sp. MMSF_3305]